MSTETRETCCICGEEIKGNANSARPVLDGVCCDECNLSTVLPYRVFSYHEEHKPLMMEYVLFDGYEDPVLYASVHPAYEGKDERYKNYVVFHDAEHNTEIAEYGTNIPEGTAAFNRVLLIRAQNLLASIEASKGLAA